MKLPARRLLSMTVFALVVVCASPSLRAAAPTEPAVAEKPVDFSRQIQPLLAKRCYACHGPGEGEGGLHLHQHDAALAELDSGAYAITPGDPDESVLLERVAADDKTMRMPPTGPALAAEEVELLRRWIAEGAEWKSHWAFEAPKPQPVPEVNNAAWVSNPIDAFILSKLEQNGLPPAPQADKAALLRRACFDLTGLPPTPAEVDAFLQDDSPDAYEKVIDRLLESPHYGERWARHWLDLVRYAETNSFERDGLKPHAWRYRDYVIRALNEDKPYDEFIREQLAGDELPGVTPESIVATGFYRLGVWDDEPADPLQAKFDGLDDLITTTSQVFLGLTINCARCHDHKIDPILQKDYYGLLAFFRGIQPMAYGGPNVETPIFRTAADRAKFAQRQTELDEKRNEAQSELAVIESEFQERLAQAGLDRAQQSDLDELQYKFYRDEWEGLPDFSELKPETVARLARPFFDIRSATRSESFGFAFTGVLKVPHDGQYTFTLDADDGARLSIAGQVVLDYDGVHGLGQPRTAQVALQTGRAPIRLEYFQAQGGQGLVVSWSGPGFGPRYLSAQEADGAIIAEMKMQPLPELMKTFGSRLLGPERRQEYQQARARLEELKREKVAGDYALWITESGSQPPETFILQRGNPHAPLERVEPSYPAILTSAKPQMPSPASAATTSGRRLALAQWIAAPDNILTARVMVNRLWQHHFGRGIVRSPNNFGQLGSPPTHPELLDWLGAELVLQGWRLKPLHKLIMLSSAYRMSSGGRPEGLLRDPANDLFWRFNMRRLSAEEIRDSMHAVSGRLNPKMFGPSIYPKISQEVLAGQSKPGDGWGESTADEAARRSVYIHVKRSLITPVLASFDFPETDATCEARFATTQPTQAIGLLNSEFVNEQAAALAERLRKEAGENREARVRLAFKLAVGRNADDDSVARGLALMDTLQRQHGVDADQSLDCFCLMVLNLNQFLYLD